MTQTRTFERLLATFSNNQSFLNSEQTNKLSRLFDSEQAFYGALLDWVKNTYSIAPISGFKVAALAIEETAQGKKIYFGTNLEFSERALSLVVHAEQAAIHNALIHGAEWICELVINASPCGYCRQFINEIDVSKQPKITVNGTTKSIKDYLPEAFGPQDLGNHHAMFSKAITPSNCIEDYFSQSYAPYSGNLAACEVIDDKRKRYFGLYTENAAYSPSLSPLQAALSQMQLHHPQCDFTQIAEITLIETTAHANQRDVAHAVLSSLSISGKAKFTYRQKN